MCLRRVPYPPSAPVAQFSSTEESSSILRESIQRGGIRAFLTIRPSFSISQLLVKTLEQTAGISFEISHIGPALRPLA